MLLLTESWKCLSRPALAGRTFAHASRGRLVAFAAAAIVQIWLTALALATWFGMTSGWRSARWLSDWGSITTRFRLAVNPASETWASWFADGVVRSLPMAIFAFVATFTVLLGLFLAFLQLPLARGDNDTLAGAMERAFRAVLAASSVLTVLLLIAGPIVITAANTRVEYTLSPTMSRAYHGILLPTAIPLALAALALLLRWTSVAALAAPRPDAHAQPATCEGCGYDLTHQPEGGKCPECATPLADSLDEGVSRPGRGWDRGVASEGGWLGATWAALATPRNYYRRLKLRTTNRQPQRFAARHLAGMGLGAAAWIAYIEALPGAPDLVRIGVAASVGAAVPISGWIVHRAVAALSLVIAGLRREQVGGAAFLKAMAYETAWLWWFCAYNGALLTLMSWGGGPWITRAIGAQLVFGTLGMPIEVFALLAGNPALMALWVLRWRRILSVIRWANY